MGFRVDFPFHNLFTYVEIEGASYTFDVYCFVLMIREVIYEQREKAILVSDWE